MKTTLAFHAFTVDTKEAKPSTEQKREAMVLRLTRAAEACNHLKT